MTTALTAKRTKCILVVCLTLLLGATAIVTPRAHAAASMPQITCHGPSCNGQAPNGSGCWSAHAYIVLSAYINQSSRQGILELWYSSDCQTNWANVRPNVPCDSHFQSERVNIQRKAGADGLYEAYPGFGMQSDCSDHTPMVWAPDVPSAADGTIYEDVGSWFVNISQSGFGTSLVYHDARKL